MKITKKQLIKLINEQQQNVNWGDWQEFLRKNIKKIILQSIHLVSGSEKIKGLKSDEVNNVVSDIVYMIMELFTSNYNRNIHNKVSNSLDNIFGKRDEIDENKKLLMDVDEKVCEHCGECHDDLEECVVDEQSTTASVAMSNPPLSGGDSLGGITSKKNKMKLKNLLNNKNDSIGNTYKKYYK